MTTVRFPGRALIAIVALLALGALIGISVDRTLLAQQPGIKRTIVLRTDDPSGPAYEAVMAVAEIGPGGSAGRHTHPGTEIGYVLEGSIVVEHAGRPGAALKAGESFKIDVGAIHDAKNSGSAPAKVLAVYIVEKGKALAEPAK